MSSKSLELKVIILSMPYFILLLIIFTSATLFSGTNEVEYSGGGLMSFDSFNEKCLTNPDFNRIMARTMLNCEGYKCSSLMIEDKTICENIPGCNWQEWNESDPDGVAVLSSWNRVISTFINIGRYIPILNRNLGDMEAFQMATQPGCVGDIDAKILNNNVDVPKINNLFKGDCYEIPICELPLMSESKSNCLASPYCTWGLDNDNPLINPGQAIEMSSGSTFRLIWRIASDIFTFRFDLGITNTFLNFLVLFLVLHLPLLLLILSIVSYIRGGF